jgi:hypothetical protein
LMSFIACKIPLCLSCITHMFGTFPTTICFNLYKNQYQLSQFSPSRKTRANGSNRLLPSTTTTVRIVPLYFSCKERAIYANDWSTMFECLNSGNQC